MDTYSYDLVCRVERERLLRAFNEDSLKANPAFQPVDRGIKKAEAPWGQFTSALSAAGVPPERLSAIAELLELHAAEAAHDADRACDRCGGDSFVPIISPVCGHVICTACLLTQKRAQELGGDGGYLKEQWCSSALAGLQFECGCGRAFSQRELAEHPRIYPIPHGLSYRGSPKVAWILRFVREHPQEKVRALVVSSFDKVSWS